MALALTPMYGDGKVIKCPTCQSTVRLVRRTGGHADHYRAMQPYELNTDAQAYNKPDPRVQKWLRGQRNGKKTVAIVGTAPNTCALAPYDEQIVKLGGALEVWGLNEEHVWDWFTNWTRWFQLHPKEYFTREVASRGVQGHYDWLKQEHNRPIYMQFRHPEIPDSVEFPLMDLVNEFLGKAYHGDRITKYFTNSLGYMMAMALHEGFRRIEIYGFEMAATEEYMQQKANAEFWMGIALGKGVEVYVPHECSLLTGPLYAYQGQGPRNLMEGSHYDDDKQGNDSIPDGRSARNQEAKTSLAGTRNAASPSGNKSSSGTPRRRKRH